LASVERAPVIDDRIGSAYRVNAKPVGSHDGRSPMMDERNAVFLLAQDAFSTSSFYVTEVKRLSELAAAFHASGYKHEEFERTLADDWKRACDGVLKGRAEGLRLQSEVDRLDREMGLL
jgi:hypothetical protein